MRPIMPLTLAFSLGIAGVVSAQVAAPPEALAAKAAVIRPSPEEVRWQQIPWLTSLVEARAAARAEGRPIFLWVTSDPPLDRC